MCNFTWKYCIIFNSDESQNSYFLLDFEAILLFIR